MPHFKFTYYQSVTPEKQPQLIEALSWVNLGHSKNQIELRPYSDSTVILMYNDQRCLFQLAEIFGRYCQRHEEKKAVNLISQQ